MIKTRLPKKTLNTSIRLVDRLMFTKHLGVMLKSGITLGEALEALSQQTRQKDMKKILTKIQAEIRNGVSLEKTLGMFPKAFDTLYRSIVAVGEKSGNLEKNLEYLAGNMAKGYEFRKKVKTAMLYPAIVLTAAGFSGVTMAVFVLPKMVEMFRTLEVELPLATRILIFVADTSRNYGLIIVPAAVGLVIAAGMVVHLPGIRPRWHALLLGLLGVGGLLSQIQVALMCRNLGIMLGSGIPVNEALGVAAEAADNLVYADYMRSMQKAVEQGRELGKEMSGSRYKHIPLVVSRMVQVGEKSGKLDESFLYLADFYEEEVDGAVKNLGTVIEPAMLVFIALVVGFVAFAIITPIYRLTGGIHR